MARPKKVSRANMKWDKETGEKSLFLPRRNQKLAKIIKVTSVKDAKGSIAELKEWHGKKGTRKGTKFDIKQATLGTSNIAGIMAKNPRNSPKVREEKRKIANMYNDAYKDLLEQDAAKFKKKGTR